MFKFCLFCFFMFFGASSFAQNFENVTQMQAAWQIRQVDEFIDRFNNSDTAITSEYNKIHGPNDKLTREKLLISLFDADNKNWNSDNIKSFIAAVNNKQNPVYLNFFDDDWYARISCSVFWKGKPEVVFLNLKVKKLADESSKWVITGVNAKFLKEQRLRDSLANSSYTVVPVPEDSTSSMEPYSHATSFMDIDQVSKDKVNIKNYYVKPVNPYNDDLLTFVNEIINNRLFIEKAIAVNYYFYQVKGWCFEVSEFNRQSRNSGWLISKLVKVTDKNTPL